MNPTDRARRRVYIFGICVPVVLLVILIGTLLFNFSITSQETARLMAENNLNSRVEEFSGHLEEELSIMTQSGMVVRDLLELQFPKKPTSALPMIGSLCANSNAYMVVYCNNRGVGVTNTGIHVNVTRDDILKPRIETEQYYTYVEKERIMQAEAIISVIPVRQNNMASGYILMYYSVNRMRELFGTYIPHRDSSLIFSVNDGLVITTEGLQRNSQQTRSSSVRKTTLPDLLCALDPDANKTALERDMRDRVVGSLSLHTAEGTQHFFYHPVGINDWYIAVGITQGVYDRLLLHNWSDMHKLITYLLALLMIFIFVVCSMTAGLQIMYKKRSKNLEKKADTDFLTGLYNKMATEREITQYLERSPDARCLLFILDVDNFKNINDTLGHEKGDQVIANIGRYMRKNFRSDDIIGRIGGDEFIIFLKDLPSEIDLQLQIERVQKIFCRFMSENDLQLEISTSIGAAVFPLDATTFTDLYRAADIALYQAKKNGKGQLFCTDFVPRGNSEP